MSLFFWIIVFNSFNIASFFLIIVFNSFNIAVQQFLIDHSNRSFQIARKVNREDSSFQIAMEVVQSVYRSTEFVYMLVEFNGEKTFNKNCILYFSSSP